MNCVVWVISGVREAFSDLLRMLWLVKLPPNQGSGTYESGLIWGVSMALGVMGIMFYFLQSVFLMRFFFLRTQISFKYVFRKIVICSLLLDFSLRINSRRGMNRSVHMNNMSLGIFLIVPKVLDQLHEDTTFTPNLFYMPLFFKKKIRPLFC